MARVKYVLRLATSLPSSIHEFNFSAEHYSGTHVSLSVLTLANISEDLDSAIQVTENS